MAIYADMERGRYPVWQSLDHVKFFPGSGLVFVTITVSLHDLCSMQLELCRSFQGYLG
jgi:hypothetical protein